MRIKKVVTLLNLNKTKFWMFDLTFVIDDSVVDVVVECATWNGNVAVGVFTFDAVDVDGRFIQLFIKIGSEWNFQRWFII